ncbi:thiamine-phosphate kinase [Paenibacillus sp. strain BS8-2]
MDEFASIAHWTAHRQTADWQRSRGVSLGIGDDAAAVDLSGAGDGIDGAKRLLLAVDTMVETVHFSDATMRDEDVGYKALAANVSDIAAMGGVPLHALVSVSVPRSYSPERMLRVYDGLYACAERYGVAVIGGDTTSSPERLVVSVTLTGTVEAGRELRRSGAKPGEAVFLTGAVGLSAAGLHLLLAEAGTAHAGGQHGVPAGERRYRETLVAAHRQPAPSVRAGRLLLAGGCSSLNDVSDGLASEAWELAEASGLRLVLHERQLPKSGSMSSYAGDSSMDALQWMLYGGEDYVLLGTIALDVVDNLRASFRAEGLPFFVIGETEAGPVGVELVRASSSNGGDREIRVSIAKQGYNHFE